MATHLLGCCRACTPSSRIWKQLLPLGAALLLLLDLSLAADVRLGLNRAAMSSATPSQFTWPKLIHHTVKNRSNIPCEQIDTMRSWAELNPGYRQIIWDDADMEKFMSTCFPHLVSMYNGFLHSVERADLFRYLVMYRLGGVYADSDVQCMKPISTWNADNNHDAALFMGSHPTEGGYEVQNWVFAGMAGHKAMSHVIRSMRDGIINEFFTQQRQGGPHDYHNKILSRTGPKMLKHAMFKMLRLPTDLPLESVHTKLWDYAVRLNAPQVLSEGQWRVWQQPKQFCEEIKAAQAGGQQNHILACHHYSGSWKTDGSKRANNFYCEQTLAASGPLPIDFCHQRRNSNWEATTKQQTNSR